MTKQQPTAAHLEGSFVFGEGVGHRGGRRQHEPEVDGHAAFPVQLRAHVYDSIRRLPHLQDPKKTTTYDQHQTTALNNKVAI